MGFIAVLAKKLPVFLMSSLLFISFCSQQNSLSIIGASPPSGGTDGGDVIHLYGTGFVAGATVRFGETSAWGVAFVSDTQLDVVIPPRLGLAGRAKITITNPADIGGDSVSSEDVFSYAYSSVRFDNARISAVGNGAVAMLAGDLNGDGKVDLVIPHSANNTLSVLLGQGNGSFQSPVVIPVASAPMGSRFISAGIGDFNGDKRLDIIVGHSMVSSDSSIGQVSILLGQNTGSLFGTSTAMGVIGEPQALAIADLNLDNQLDITVAGGSHSTITTYIGTGGGTFIAGQTLSMDGFVNTIAISDMDADGFPDLISGNGSNVQVWIAETKQVQSTSQTDSQSQTMTITEATGIFQSGPKIDTGPLGQIAFTSISDMNRDGLLDIALLGDASVAVYLSKGGSGTELEFFLSAFLPPSSSPKALIAQDINGDGLADVVIPTLNTTSVVISKPEGGYKFLPSLPIPTGASLQFVSVQDMNNDGKVDLILWDQTQSQVMVFLNISQ